MLKAYVWLKGLLSRENGQDMIEYALIASVISIAVVLATALILEPAFSSWANGIKSIILSNTPSGGFF